jgi:CMP-N-acetylneuraminic acid synthetase
MSSNLKTLAIIPARKGSKGVPKKNTIVFGGKSLLQMAVDCALDSENINKILINSDDQGILDLINVPENDLKILKQLRPKHLAEDNSTIVDVVLQALKNLNEKFDIILLLQVTAPLRSSVDIENILKYFENDDQLEGVISVIPVEDHHPARMYHIQDDKLISLNEVNENKHRQNLTTVYLRNGCFYAIKTKVFLEQKTFMPKYKKAFVMNSEHLLNIDSTRDVIIAEALIKAYHENRI